MLSLPQFFTTAQKSRKSGRFCIFASAMMKPCTDGVVDELLRAAYCVMIFYINGGNNGDDIRKFEFEVDWPINAVRKVERAGRP